MGEDSCRNGVIDKKAATDCHLTNGVHHNNNHFNNMNGSAISSCSEADSESTTCVGESKQETVDEQDYQYGPGIVSKLRTKFLSITLKQSRGGAYNMRRSCSLENILDSKSTISPTNTFVSPNRFGPESKASLMTSSSWSNLKRAKSMDTLLLSVTEEQTSRTIHSDICAIAEVEFDKAPKVIRRKEGTLNRTTITICDEELPKPDTVKTYKRMFEPAESKKSNNNSNVRRRPPVLRATAKSGSTSTGKSTGPSSKTNGAVPNSLPVIKNSKSNKSSAKESSNPAKETSSQVISNLMKNELKTPEENRNATKNAINANLKKKEGPAMNGLMKAEPVKFKQKEETLKRNFRAPKCPDGEGITIKPAIPAKKPLIHPKNLNTIAQALEKRISGDKNVHFMKQAISNDKFPALKPILAKHNKPVVSAPHKIKLDRVSTPVSDETHETVIKPLVENGISPNPPETTTTVQQDTAVKSECEPVLNGFFKAEPVEIVVLPEQKPPPSTSKIDLPGHKVVQNGDGPKDLLKDIPVRKTNSIKSSGVNGSQNSMVFDFRGKEVITHLAIIPAPFGCRKAPAASKKRGVLLDGKEPYALNGFMNGDALGLDEDDDEFVDYSTPQPCGLTFEGENIRVGKGAFLASRNKDLKIQFDEDVEKNTFVYPSESCYLSDDSSSMSSSDFSSLEDNNVKLTNGVAQPTTTTKLRANTAIGSNGVGGLMSYTPSVLRTVDNFQPGIFRGPEKDEQKTKDKKDGGEGEEENRERKEQEQNGVSEDSEADSGMLKPADPEFISSWSLSANTSDLLF